MNVPFYIFSCITYIHLNRVNELRRADLALAQLLQTHQDALKAAAAAIDLNLGSLELAFSEQLLRNVPELVCEFVVFGAAFAGKASLEWRSKDAVGHGHASFNVGVDGVNFVDIDGEEQAQFPTLW